MSRDDALAQSSGDGTGIATPSSRRRVDGVEDDAMIQHATLQNAEFDFHTP